MIVLILNPAAVILMLPKITIMLTSGDIFPNSDFLVKHSFFKDGSPSSSIYFCEMEEVETTILFRSWGTSEQSFPPPPQTTQPWYIPQSLTSTLR